MIGERTSNRDTLLLASAQRLGVRFGAVCDLQVNQPRLVTCGGAA
jgi:hypothetical protein